jgi:hypothetical protein
MPDAFQIDDCGAADVAMPDLWPDGPPSDPLMNSLQISRVLRLRSADVAERVCMTWRVACTALFGWTRTGDEDAYQSSDALLPITPGAHIRDADHRPKQFGGVNISSHIAALLRALHQLFDCSLDQAARSLIEPRSASGDAVESGRDDVLCRDVVDKQQQPGAQGLDRRHCGDEAARCRGQLFHLTPIDRFDQRIPCREMAIQGTCSDTRLLRDVVQTGSRAVARKSPLRHFENSLALRRASVRGFRLAGWECFFFISKISCNRRLSPIIYSLGDCLRFNRAAALRQFGQ